VKRLAYCLGLLVVLAGLGLAPIASRAAGSSDAAGFVSDVVAEALQTLRDPAISEEAREQRFDALLTRNFDLPRLSRYVLGRYWATASADERGAFDTLFARWVVRSYSARLGQYRSETVTVTGARAESETSALVTSQIIHPSGPPTKVEWRVSRHDGQMKIVDIDVEGISLALTEREEVAAVIQRNGGTVTGLNRTLAERMRGDTATAATAQPQ
jgi:phospholipid transport system substrate-binding protein